MNISRPGARAFIPTFAGLVFPSPHKLRFIVLAGIALLLLSSGLPAAEILQVGGKPCELRISQVSGRTLRIQLFPLDSQDQPLPLPYATDVVPLTAVEKLRIRRLSAEKV